MKKSILLFLFCTMAFLKMKANSDSLIVYIFLSETCPICQNQTYSLRQLNEQFANKNVGFVGVFPNQEFSTAETIAKFGKKYRLDFALIKDEKQALTNKLGAVITPQVVAVQHNTDKIIYKGKIDNSYERVGRRRPIITEFYLRDAINQYLEGNSITLKETTPVGCYIVK